MTRRRNGECVVLVVVALPAYRHEPVRLLLERLAPRCRGYVGDAYFAPTVRTAESIRDLLGAANNHYFLGRRLLWQTGFWRDALSAETALFELNPRILSSWVILAVRRMLRRPRSVLWGHAWPRRSRRARSDALRHMMRMLGDVLLVYTEQEAAELRLKMPTKRVVAAPNALYGRRAIGAVSDKTPENFIFTGRLVAAKKPRLLVDAFASARPKLPSASRLVIVGDGPLKPELERAAAAAGVAHRVDFAGEVTAWDELRTLYSTALASVSPGYVGLSLIQSLGFGVPMIIARGEPHSPEIEAAEPGENCIMFEGNSTESLGHALASVADDADGWRSRRRAISEECARRYSVEVMVDRMLSAMTR